MKKILALFIIIQIAFAVVMTGCNVTQSPKATVETETVAKVESSEDVLSKYFNSFIEGDNPLYGTWKMESFDYISFIFRNDGYAEMAIGTEGSFSYLKIDEEKKTLDVAFVLGLTGEYSYKFANENKVLKLTKDGKVTTLKKTEDYNFIPQAPQNVVVDESILGWWKSKEGLIYYFGNDGIMYSYGINIETCYTYEASGGKVKAVYTFDDEVVEDFEYKLTKKGKLKIEDNLFESYNPFK